MAYIVYDILIILASQFALEVFKVLWHLFVVGLGQVLNKKRRKERDVGTNNLLACGQRNHVNELGKQGGVSYARVNQDIFLDIYMSLLFCCKQCHRSFPLYLHQFVQHVQYHQHQTLLNTLNTKPSTGLKLCV